MGNIRLVKEGRSKGEVESAIRNAVIKFEQEFMGRGPDDVRAFIVRDIILVRLKGVLTPAERQLAKTQDGVEMVKRLRQNLIAQGRDKLCEQMSNITGGTVTARGATFTARPRSFAPDWFSVRVGTSRLTCHSKEPFYGSQGHVA